jgi:AcrR family transcriptional regulator
MARKIDPNKREAILKSARELFKQCGVEHTTMSQIAVKAGVATGTIYLYFKSKAQIVDALCDYYLLGNITAVAPEYEKPDIQKAISGAIHAALKHASENADLVRLIDLRRSNRGKTKRPQADKVVQKTLREGLAKYIREGSMRPYNVVVMAELISGMLEWISKVCFVWSDVDPMRYEDTLVEMLRHALLINCEEKQL